MNGTEILDGGEWDWAPAPFIPNVGMNSFNKQSVESTKTKKQFTISMNLFWLALILIVGIAVVCVVFVLSKRNSKKREKKTKEQLYQEATSPQMAQMTPTENQEQTNNSSFIDPGLQLPSQNQVEGGADVEDPNFTPLN
jgi:flagellar biosynthesis/type III secretory pathway M-ring protein FliF/YscJ